jgi:hypothetical protein
MYEDGEVEDTESGVTKFERTFHRRDKQRDEWLRNLQEERKLSYYHARNFELPAFAPRPLLCADTPAGIGTEILQAIHKMKLSDHMSSFLCANDLFVGFARNSWLSSRDKPFFEAFYTMSDEDEDMFDKSCAIIFSDLYDDLVISSTATRAVVKKSFDYQTFAYLQSKRLDDAIATLPRGMAECRLPCTVVVRIIANMLVDYSYAMMDSFVNDLKSCAVPLDQVDGSQKLSALVAVTNSSLEKEINGHVNRFFGFAIHGVTKYWKKRASNGDDSIDDDDDDTECLESKALAFVDEMYILHVEAMGNSWYMEHCYSTSLQLCNQGGLKLVSPSYFEYGKSLMKLIGSLFNLRALGKHGRRSIAKAYDTVVRDDNLWNQFLSCSESTIPVATKRKIYEQLVSKAFHARVGVVTDRFNEVITGHYATKASGQGFRTELQAVTKKKSAEIASGAKRKLSAMQKEYPVATS